MLKHDCFACPHDAACAARAVYDITCDIFLAYARRGWLADFMIMARPSSVRVTVFDFQEVPCEADSMSGADFSGVPIAPARR